GESAFTTYILHQTDWRSDRLRRVRNHVGDFVSAPWSRLEAVLRAARPELVHTNNLPGLGTGIWEVARRLGVPVVHSLHDYHLLCPRTSLTWRDGSTCEPHPLLCGARTRRLMRWQGAVDSVIAVSEYVRSVYREFFPGVLQHVIRPPLAPLSGPIPQPPRTPPVTLGFLGALTAIKGVRLLLDAAPFLARQGLKLRFAGDGALRRDVEAAEGVDY